MPRTVRGCEQDPETGVWRIKLTRGQYALVDECDAAYMGQWNWRAAPVHTKAGWYGLRGVWDGTRMVTLMMHRVLAARFLPLTSDLQVDHENGNGLDNRRANIRLATPLQNVCNQGKQSNNQSGFKGVRWDTRGQCWRASIGYQGRKHHLGMFDTPEEAHAAYVAAAERLHGDFASM